MEAPEYNANARRFDPKLYIEKKRVEVCPISPPVEALVGTLTQEWEDSYRETEDGTILFAPGVAAKRIGSVSGVPLNSDTCVKLHPSYQYPYLYVFKCTYKHMLQVGPAVHQAMLPLPGGETATIWTQRAIALLTKTTPQQV